SGSARFGGSGSYDSSDDARLGYSGSSGDSRPGGSGGYGSSGGARPSGGAGVAVPFALVAIVVAAVVSVNVYLMVSNGGWDIRLPDIFSGAAAAVTGAAGSGAGAAGTAGASGVAGVAAASAAGGIGAAGMATGATDGDGQAAIEPALSIPYDSDEGTQFCFYRNYIAECSKDWFFLFDKSGREAFKKNIEFAAPSLKKSGDYLLVCDIGGRTAFVMDGVALKWEDKFASGIINASVSDDGYVSVILDASGYRNTVRLFAPFGRRLFDWVVAEDYVISAAMSPSGKELMLNRVKTGGLSARSGLEFLDLRSEPFAAVESEDGKVFLSASYLSDGSIAVATETDFAIYSDGREAVVEESFDSVMAMSVLPRSKVALAAQSGGAYAVMEFASKGGEPGRTLLEPAAPVLNMASGAGCLLVNMGSRVTVLGDGGKLSLDMPFDDAEALYGDVSDKAEVMAVTNREARIYKIG
ncbi:MAG: DUF5711 family protein, partial [Clostridiales bacterium]|nr:DUF5711 family protein [Clostridiales bacterium]